ncbi:MAG: hypothetical protein ACXWV0_05730 [Flavisolibacter sp.]
MKQTYTKLVLLLVLFTCSYGMCSKDDAHSNSNPPPPIHLNKGFLATKGINSIHVPDTICLRNSSSGRYSNITDFTYYAEAGGFIQRPRDFYDLVSAGANQYYIKVTGGQYLGYKFNPNATNYNRYTYTTDVTANAHNLFMVNWTGDKFSIRPAANPAVYLSTMPADVQPPNPSHEILRYLEGNPQLWWFIQ